MGYRRVEPPEGVVVFFKIVKRPEASEPEYEETDARMYEIVSGMPGFVSIKSFTAEDGERVSIVRFRSEQALDAWRTLPEHRQAQARGRERWYDSYWIQVCQVIREYEWTRDAPPG